jgi:MinD superfamily P-loop ATPase
VNARPEGAILVTTPQEVALATMRKAVDFCRKMDLKVVGVVENMSGYQCPCCQENWHLFSEDGATRLTEEYGFPLLGTVPLDPALVQCCEEGRSVFADHPESPAATAIMKIATNIHNNMTHLQPT